MSDKTARCTTCAAEFTDDELKNAKCCPKCGTTGVPNAIADDVLLKINWHELRILGIWASNWAERGGVDNEGSRKCLAAIIERLEKQFPDKTPLTLLGELKQCQQEFPTLEARDEAGNIILPRKKVQ